MATLIFLTSIPFSGATDVETNTDNNQCPEYTQLKNEYQTLSKQVSELDTTIDRKLKTILPIYSQYIEEKDVYNEELFVKLTWQGTILMYHTYPIYKESPYDEIGMYFIVNKKGFDDQINQIQGTIYNCYKNLEGSADFVEPLKQLNENKTDLPSNSELHQKVNEDSFMPCLGDKVNDEFKHLLDQVRNYVSKAPDYMSQRKSLLAKQYNCQINPISIAKKHQKEVLEFETPIFKNMTTHMKPHMRGFKKNLQDILLKYNVESYDTHLRDIENKKSFLNEMTFSGTKTEFDEGQINTFLQSTQSHLESTRNHLSTELSNKLNDKIHKLQQTIVEVNAHNTMAKNNEIIYQSLLEDITQLIKITTEAAKHVKKITDTAESFITKIDTIEPMQDDKDYFFTAMREDNKIRRFLQKEYQPFNTGMVEKDRNIQSRISETKSKFQSLDTSYKTLEANKETITGNYQQLKSNVDQITELDIPQHIRNLNMEFLNAKLPNEMVHITLKSINQQNVNLLTTIKAHSTKLEQLQLSAIKDSLKKARIHLSSINQNNDSFKSHLSAQNSQLKSDAKKVSDSFSTIIANVNGELDKINEMVTSLDSKISTEKSEAQTCISNLEDISRRETTLDQGYEQISSSRATFLGSLDNPPDQFKSLVLDATRNSNYADELSKLTSDFEKYQKEVSSLTEKVNKSSGDVRTVSTMVDQITKRIKNMEVAHTKSVDSLKYGLKWAQEPNLNEINKIMEQITQSLKKQTHLIEKSRTKISADQTYYDESVKNGNMLVSKISEVNKNQMISKLLREELSVEQTFESFQRYLNDFAQAIDESNKKLETNDGENKKFNEVFNREKIILESTLKAIKSLFTGYNILEDASTIFDGDHTMITLDNVNNELKTKYELIKSTTRTLESQQVEFSKLANVVNREIESLTKDIEDDSTYVRDEKQKHRTYFKKLNSVEETAVTLTNGFNLLSEKKRKLNEFLNSSKNQYEQESNSIENKKNEIAKRYESKINQYKQQKGDIEVMYEKYNKLHERTLNKANKVNTDISTELKNEFTSLENMKEQISNQFEELIVNVTNFVEIANSHYVHEIKQLTENYNSRKTKSSSLLTNIDTMLNNIVTMTSTDTSDDIPTAFNELVNKIDTFLEENKSELTINEFNQTIDLKNVDGIPEFKTKLEKAKKSEGDFAKSLNSTNGSKKVNQPVSMTIEDSEIKENLDDNHDSNYSEIKGESLNIASTDYFKLIMTIGTISLLALIVVGAVLRFKANMKNRIYEKCENIYVKV